MASERLVDTTLVAFAHKLADSAGCAIRPYFRQALSITNKAEQRLFDPVTEADRSAESAMRTLILAEYPAHGICGEEFEDKAAEGPYRWVLDPIDGTRSFILGLPTWGTLIGLTRDGEPVLGMMDQPYTGERFWSSGEAAHFRNASGEHIMRTRRCPALGDAIMTATTPDMFKTSPENERFYALAATAFGQGELAVTPLQLALVAAAIANDGKMPQPYVTARVQTRAGRTLEVAHPRLLATVMSPRTAAVVRDMMVDSVDQGWARTAAIKGVPVGGKTGTAETAADQTPHSWFIGFVPGDQPRYAVAVILERAGFGSAQAAPAAKKIMEAALQLR